MPSQLSPSTTPTAPYHPSPPAHRDGRLRHGREASRWGRRRPAPAASAAANRQGGLAAPDPCSGPAPRSRAGRAGAAAGARPVGAVPGGAEPGDAGDAGQGRGVQQGGAVHEGHQGLPAVRLLPHRRADPALARRALRHARRARQRGAPAGAQGVLQLAHLPAALHRRRVLRRM